MYSKQKGFLWGLPPKTSKAAPLRLLYCTEKKAGIDVDQLPFIILFLLSQTSCLRQHCCALAKCR